MSGIKKVKIGNTGIEVNKNGFGALPIQRRSTEDAVKILRKAYDNGIDYYDTARVYSDSETKIGLALSDVRDKIYIATKTMATTAEKLREDLETSLRELKTDYIDIYQLHNPAFCPKPGDESGIYDEAMKAKKEGKIRHIGITNHMYTVALEAIDSGLYETMQFPFSYISGDKEMEIMKRSVESGMGFFCMKGLAGGLIKRSDAAYAFMDRFDGVLPIWGIQKEEELDEFLSYQVDTPVLDDEMKAFIEKEKEELAGNFCRGCGYCQPCPMEIDIKNCNRMSLMIRRAPTEAWTTDFWQKEMMKIEDCIECHQCIAKCPYGIDIPNTLKENLADYKTFI